MTSGERRFKSNATWSNCRGLPRPRQENHSSPEISAAIRGVKHRDKPNEGRRPSQQGHVNEHASDRDQKVQTHGARHFEGAGGVRAARPPLRARDRNRRRTRNHGRGPVREKRMAAHARDGCAHRIVEVERTLVRRRMARRAASSTPCKPHLVWCTSITSRVPRKRCEITKEPR